MSYENSQQNQVVKPEYRQSINGVLHTSIDTMRHLLGTSEGKENLISARTAAILAGQNIANYILGSQNSQLKDLEVELESVSGKGILISASYKTIEHTPNKAGIFFVLSTCVANIMQFYPKDSEMLLHSITSEQKRASAAYIKSSYLAPPPAPAKPSYKPKPIPYTYAEDRLSSKDNVWRDSLDDWKNPYAKEHPVDSEWKNPYLSSEPEDFEQWDNPYKNEPILDTNPYSASEDKNYPKDDGITSNSIKINFLDPLAETLGVSELDLSTTTLSEYTIKGVKHALMQKYPQWANYFSSNNLMFSVNRQVSMSEYDSVAGGALVTIFLTG